MSKRPLKSVTASNTASNTEMVLLTMGETEVGLVPAETSNTDAQELANEHGCVVTIRTPTSDQVLGTVEPNSVLSGTGEASSSGVGSGTITVSGHIEHRTTVLPGAVFPSHVHAEAWARADGLNKREFQVIPVESGFAFEKITRVKVEKPKVEKKNGPSGFVAEIIALALRPEGVTAQELNELTKWNGAPWKWNFSNPKDGGWSAKWGYGFYTSKVNGTVHYHLTKPESESEEAA